VPVKAAIDYVATRRDLDASRVGMWGVSLAAITRRARGVRQAHQGLPSRSAGRSTGRGLGRLPELTRDAFRVRSHAKTDAEARKNAATLSLDRHRRQTSPVPFSS